MENRFEELVISAAADGAVILTANKRLYRHLRTLYDRYMLARQARVWPSASIFSYDAWQLHQFDGLDQSGRLLSSLQQRYLWENLIAAATQGTALELLNLERTAEMAVSAHNLLSEYDVALKNQKLTADQQMFLGWRTSYLELCARQQWLDQGSLPARILQAFECGEIPLPDKILLVGFDQLPPGAVKLQDLMHSRAKVCDQVDTLAGTTGSIIRCAADDEGDETERMARWVHHLLEQGADSIGVVVPDLQRRRSLIERVLKRQIDPQGTVTFDETAVFGLSLGSPLANEGVVAAALACLDAGFRLSLDQASFLLRTPFISGSIREKDRRALFDRHLRSLQQGRFSLNSLIQLTGSFGGMPLFQRFLSSFKAAARNLATAEKWADIFATELKNYGWPGEAKLSSVSYQAVKAWYDKALSGFEAVDPGATPITRGRALRILGKITSETEFQPQSVAGPVQVVGLLESSGLHFDHLWVMGLQAGTFPSLPRPNPFIPFRLQDELQMPHASFSRELEFAKRVLQRLRHAAPQIVFSYPLRSKDSDLSPSPLIQSAGNIAEPPRHAASNLSELMRCQVDDLEPWVDDKGPAVTTAASSGGTRLLQDQAHCPFRAFVHHRLAVQDFDKAAPGLSPMIRGELVHLVLQRLWQQLNNQEGYLQLGSNEAKQLFDEQIDKVLTLRLGAQHAQSKRLYLLEKQRLSRLVAEWFEQVEQQRASFVVEQTEQVQKIMVGPLQLSLKVDRIDRLATGERIIIDYKTGTDMRTTDLLTRPLIEPQLPCYAVAGGEQSVDGVIVGQVRAGACRLSGIVRHGAILANMRSVSVVSPAEQHDVVDWKTLNEFWQHQLLQLATDFSNGVATVTPFDQQKSCRYCDLPGLCRIGEIDLEAGDD